MSLDGNGSYSPPAPQFPAIPNTIIYADDFNQIILDIATALSTAIFRDGQAAFTVDQSMGGHKLTNLANGVNPQDATTVLQVFTDPVFIATTAQGFKITGSMFQALMTTINLVASGTLTLTGTTLLDASASGEVRLPGNTSIGTVSAAELAVLDGLTASTAELNVLDGITASTAELNLLDGVTVSTADLNSVVNRAPINSPAFTGIPTAPTAPLGTNTNQIATMAALLAQAFATALPNQAGNAGKFVTTDGTNASWAAVFPSQTGNSGKLLSTDGSNPLWKDAPGTQVKTASGAITAGNPVQQNSDDTVSIGSITLTTTLGAIASLSSALAATIVYVPTVDRYFAAYVRSSDSFLMGVLGTPASDGSISWDTPSVIRSSAVRTDARPCAIYHQEQDKVVLCSADASTVEGTGWVITVTASSFSVGTGVGYGRSDNRISLSYDSANQKIVVVCVDGSTSFSRALVGTVSGTTLSWGTAYDFGVAFPEMAICFDPSTGKHLAIGRQVSNTVCGAVGTVSGTTISFGSIIQLNASGEPGFASLAYSNTAQKIAVSFKGASTVNTFVATISGSSVSVGSVASFSGDGGHYTTMCYDSYLDKMICTYKEVTSTYISTRTGTISGTSISWGSATVIQSAASTYIGSSTFDTARNRTAAIWDNGSTVYSATIKAGSLSLTSDNFLGFAESTVANGASVRVNCVGDANSSQSGLTAGSKYYVNASGGLTTTNTGIYGGLALSATKILVKG